MKRRLCSWYLLTLVVLAIYTGVGVAGELRHQDEEEWLCLMAVDQDKGIIYIINQPDGELTKVALEGPITEARLDESGSLLAAVDRNTDRLWLYSSGVGWGVDQPVLYRQLVMGGSPGRLSTAADKFVVVNDREHTVSVVFPDSGVVLTVPVGHGGPARLSGERLLAVDVEYGLVDIFNVAHLHKQASLKIGSDPGGIAVDRGFAWVADERGMNVIDITAGEQMLLPVDWPQAPQRLLLNPENLWVYGLSAGTLFAINTMNGKYIALELDSTGPFTIGEDRKQLAAACPGDAGIYLLDISSGEPSISQRLQFPAETKGPVRDLVLVDSGLYAAVGSVVGLFSGGRFHHILEVDGSISRLLVYKPQKEGRAP